MIASETASRHQPMNWHDSIWVRTSVTQEAFPKRKPQRLVSYSENKGYASNPRRFNVIIVNAVQIQEKNKTDSALCKTQTMARSY